tara:strand:+ start:1524 stop:2546 length:1023 start_codon:yes stop_codon:yes gene_type:complete
MKVLVTGIAGFIGFHLSKALLERGDEVVGIDNINNYYDPSLKNDRLKELEKVSLKTGNLNFVKGDIENKELIEECFDKNSFNKVVNLAAQAGVRKSLEDPYTYIESNIYGFLTILEACRHSNIEHLVYASTSSVYGLNESLPFQETKLADHPIQLYAATKRSNELMAHSYSHLFEIPTTGMRFFTVYGPWGRPDMALHLFTKNIIEGKPIKVFNDGNHSRDFTYIDDIVAGILLLLDKPPSQDNSWNPNSMNPSDSSAPYKVFNIGNGKRVNLSDYITAIELELGIKAKKTLLPIQKGDVPDSLSDISKIKEYTGYEAKVSYKEGIANFVKWYKNYYGFN